MLEFGSQVASYEILEMIGAGGMGEVYRARDTKLDREVAVKVLPEVFTKDLERLARFEREAKLLASLNHPNIATVHGLEESEGMRFLVMELVAGKTLSERIAGKPIPLEDALPIFKQIAEALEAAHEKGVIHRDLKPANIKVTPEGKVKVLDFGLAKALTTDEPVDDSSQSPTLTKGTALGAIMGTAPYMSPEQARGKAVDKRTDIWAFGCCLFEALTGRKAFTGETVSDTIGAILQVEPEWNRLAAKVPVGTRNLLRRCLQKDPNRRLRDAWDARLEIEEDLAAPLSGSHVTDVAKPSPTYRSLLMIALAFILGGLVAWGAFQRYAPEERAVARLAVTLPSGEMMDVMRTGIPLSLSPDGKHLVYVTRQGGESRLYVRALDAFKSIPIPGTEGAHSPFFSPDGNWIGYFTDREVKKVAVQGGAPVTICETSLTSGGGSWSEDGDIIFSTYYEGPMRVSSEGGAPVSLVAEYSAGGWSQFQFLQILPGGRHMLFGGIKKDGTGLFTHSFETGEERLVISGNALVPRYLPSGHLVYGQGGSLLAVPFDVERLEIVGAPVSLVDGVYASAGGNPYFTVSRSGTLAYIPGEAAYVMVWVDRRGRATSFSEDRGIFWFPDLAPSGKRVAVTKASANGPDIWIYDSERGTRTRLTADGTSVYPVWTRDESRVAFMSDSNLFEIPTDGGGRAEPLLVREGSQNPTSWTYDGGTLLFQDNHPETGLDIWMISEDGKPTPVVATQFDERASTLSPDGRWIAYVSNETGRNEVYVQPFPDLDRKWTISGEGGTEPVWSADGSELFYRRENEMIAVEVELVPSFRIRDENVLFEGDYDRNAVSCIPAYDVSPDGQRFLMIKRDESTAPRQINVILNWSEELKRLVPTN